MKTNLLSLLLSATVLTASTTSSFAQKSGDEAAIRQVIDATQLAFDKRDIEALGVHFVQSPDFYFRVTPSVGNGMVFVANGYDNAVKMIGDQLNGLTTVKPPKHTLSQYAVHNNGSSAWTTYILTDELPDGQKINTCQFSVFEKKAGTWKIAAITRQDYPDGKMVGVQSENSKEDTAIREVITRFYDGWNVHDADKMVSFYADSVDHINAFAAWRTGKQTMKEELIKFHAGPGKDSRKTITFEKIKFITPDVAMAIVRQISKVGNLGMYILSKESGKWLVVSFANVPYTLKTTEAKEAEKKQD